MTIAALLFAACGNQKKKGSAEDPAVTASDTSATAFKYDYETIFRMFCRLPEEILPDSIAKMDEASLREALQISRLTDNRCEEDECQTNSIWWNDYSEAAVQTVGFTVFKYNDPDRFFAVYERGKGTDVFSIEILRFFDYDAKTGTLTAVESPLPNYKMMDFFDELTLCGMSEEERVFHEKKAFEPSYIWSQDCVQISANLYDRYDANIASKTFAFSWNGKTFIRDEAKDRRPNCITNYGFACLQFGSELPFEIKGYELINETAVAEGEEYPVLKINKDGKLVMLIKPAYDFDEQSYLNTVDDIIVYSSDYSSDFGAPGDPASEVFNTDASSYVFLNFDGDVVIDVYGIQLLFDEDALKNKIPEDYYPGEEIKDPEFREDARVKAVRIYNSAG